MIKSSLFSLALLLCFTQCAPESPKVTTSATELKKAQSGGAEELATDSVSMPKIKIPGEDVAVVEGQADADTSAAFLSENSPPPKEEELKELDPKEQEPEKTDQNEEKTAKSDRDREKDRSSKSDSKRKKRRPAISFKKTTHHYGRITQGDKIEHKFTFVNTGKRPLVISNATATCGCTQPSFPFIPIDPGEEGYIGVVFDSKGKLGRQKPAITITTNARPATYKLYLEGYVDARKDEEDGSGEKSTGDPPSGQ